MVKAKIYLSKDNVTTLDAQLKETYNESLVDLSTTTQEKIEDYIVVVKENMPKLLIKKNIRRVIEETLDNSLNYNMSERTSSYTKTTYTVSEATDKILQTIDEQTVGFEDSLIDCYKAAVEISLIYRISSMTVYTQLQKLYPDGFLPQIHLQDI